MQILVSFILLNDADYRALRGYEFHLVDKHLSKEEMDVLRGQYDELGSAALVRLLAIFAKQKVC